MTSVLNTFYTQSKRLVAVACLASAVAIVPLTGQAQGLRMPGSGSASGGLTGSGASAAGAFANDLQGAASNAAASSRDGSSNRQADFIIALVNSEPITNVELQNRMVPAREYFAQQGQNPSEARIRQEVLNVLIAERLQLQEAKATNLTVDDFTLNQAEANVAAKNNVSVTTMYQELASSGIGREQFRRQMRNQLTLMRIRERAVEARVRVTDQELDRYLREHPVDQGEAIPEALNLGHILVVVPEKASAAEEAQLKQRIDQAAEALAAGKNFADVAKEYSQANEASRGGELGLRPVTQYPDLFANAVADKAVGTVVGPIRSGAGFHILKVLERQEGGAGMVIQNHARHILMTAASGRSAQEVGDMLMEIRDRVVRNGEDFAVLARQYSEDGSAKDGGDLGWAGPGMFVPEFQAALDELQPGDVSQPVVSRFGLHLIQLLDRRQHKMTQQEQRELVRNEAREKKVEEEYQKWIDGLKARAFIEMRDQDN
ncbi:molecular chaperone SurA [Lampropedia puyangensis]|uniref:Chaperone SurA n=1 Tax=Lampropedia puyangensis TaxID=1330072 RepID=A0A4S8FEA9_9BURK|nr:peptidylprolyl isomerase [Lampropedia puyangensis]THU05411.1 molecular chaperone SurA [Lampropedia puyangensis]